MDWGGQLSIGQFVKSHIPAMVEYCRISPSELDDLTDPNFCQNTFRLGRSRGIPHTFFSPADEFPPRDKAKYWRETYYISGKTYYACSQWYSDQFDMILAYLQSRGIISNSTQSSGLISRSESTAPQRRQPNSRFKLRPIANAQNQLVRFVLSSLGEDLFGEADWEAAKAFFDNRCAYCAEESSLEIDHAIPMNKEKLGEHRLGNLVPSCRRCNSNKGGLDFQEFLSGKPNGDIKANRIRLYMESRGYTPLGHNSIVKLTLEQAYKDVANIAERYIVIINALMKNPNNFG